MKQFFEETPSQNPCIEYPKAYNDNISYVPPNPIPHQAELYPPRVSVPYPINVGPTMISIILNNLVQPVNVVRVNLSNDPRCRQCKSNKTPIIRRKIGKVGIIWIIILLVTTGFLFFIPFCCNSCKDVVLNCANCGAWMSTIPARFC